MFFSVEPVFLLTVFMLRVEADKKAGTGRLSLLCMPLRLAVPAAIRLFVLAFDQQQQQQQQQQQDERATAPAVAAAAAAASVLHCHSQQQPAAASSRQQ